MDVGPFPSEIFEALGSPTTLCILGSRIFFNLKEAAEHGVNVGTNWASYSHSAIRFDESQPGEQFEFVKPSLIRFYVIQLTGWMSVLCSLSNRSRGTRKPSK